MLTKSIVHRKINKLCCCYSFATDASCATNAHNVRTSNSNVKIARIPHFQYSLRIKLNASRLDRTIFYVPSRNYIAVKIICSARSIDRFAIHTNSESTEPPLASRTKTRAGVRTLCKYSINENAVPSHYWADLECMASGCIGQCARLSSERQRKWIEPNAAAEWDESKTLAAPKLQLHLVYLKENYRVVIRLHARKLT